MSASSKLISGFAGPEKKLSGPCRLSQKALRRCWIRVPDKAAEGQRKNCPKITSEKARISLKNREKQRKKCLQSFFCSVMIAVAVTLIAVKCQIAARGAIPCGRELRGANVKLENWRQVTVPHTICQGQR